MLKVQEHENKMRYIMNSNGGKLAPYIFGLFIPDLLLLTITIVVFMNVVKFTVGGEL